MKEFVIEKLNVVYSIHILMNILYSKKHLQSITYLIYNYIKAIDRKRGYNKNIVLLILHNNDGILKFQRAACSVTQVEFLDRYGRKYILNSLNCIKF